MSKRQGLADDIRAEGVKARAAGKASGDNPYPSGSPEFAAWERGWSSSDNPDEKQLPTIEAPTR
jgi:hypothetical protein